jgi:hypothetical protein
LTPLSLWEEGPGVRAFKKRNAIFYEESRKPGSKTIVLIEAAIRGFVASSSIPALSDN